MNHALLASVFLAGSVLLATETPAVAPAGRVQLLAADTVPSAAPGNDTTTVLFRTSDRCIACHKGIATSDGTDVSIGYDWRASMMANSARDPYWRAAVRREITDYPEAAGDIEAKCSRCHMPMANVTAVARGGRGSVFETLADTSATSTAALAIDGVSCAACHQIGPEGLGAEESVTGGFHVSTEIPDGGRPMFGPFQPDPGGVWIMRSTTGFRPGLGTHIQSSEMCASCHTLFTHAVRADGDAGPEFSEQVPYLEWQASSYARAGTSCQDCHMPEVEEEVRVSGVLGRPRGRVSRHVFRGGNFFMLRLLDRYRDELEVVALPEEMQRAADRTEAHLKTSTATVRIVRLTNEDDRLEATVEVRNRAGHRFPTGYPSRRAWLHLTVRDGAGATVFESGAFSPDGRVVGDDNDDDPARYEPHWEEIGSPDQVQIYQAVMTDRAGAVTTGLMSAEGWVKDNRLLPEGFDASAADGRVTVLGGAERDFDFAAGFDQVLYAIDAPEAAGPYTVEVELWFQPIAYRWAENLADYDTPETQRFVGYYRAMAETSAIVVASARTGTR